MLDFAFFYYISVCSLAILLNLFIILASTRPYIRGEFKWVFLGAAITNTLLSLSQLILMPSALKWPGKNEYSLVATSNPLLQQAARAIVPNVLPLAVILASYHLGMTRFEDIATFPEAASNSLVNRIDSEKYCTLKSNYREPGDIITTAFLIFCPLASYVITIAAVPLLTYLPLFLSILIVDNSWGISSKDAQWYDMSVVHYAAAWGPALDAFASIACLKPYRRAFLELIGFASTTTEQKILAFTKRIGTGQKHDSRRNSHLSQHSVIHELDVGGIRGRDSTIESFLDARPFTTGNSTQNHMRRPVSAMSDGDLRETRV
ncbi:hypothetical protein Aduo_001351 [Ancylostoma duodenale]